MFMMPVRSTARCALPGFCSLAKCSPLVCRMPCAQLALHREQGRAGIHYLKVLGPVPTKGWLSWLSQSSRLMLDHAMLKGAATKWRPPHPHAAATVV